MKPIENVTGVERAVSALLGKTTEVLTQKLADTLGNRPAAKKRRRPRKAVAASRARQAKAGKGGLNHG